MTLRILWLIPVATLALAAPVGAQTIEYIAQLTVTHTTSTVANAGTNDLFDLLVRSTSGASCPRPFPKLPYDEREPGKTDTYTFDVSDCKLVLSQVHAQTIFIRTNGTNAWLPSKIMVVAKTTATATFPTGRQITLANHVWPGTSWFSRDPNDKTGLPVGATVLYEWAVIVGAPKFTLSVATDGHGLVQGTAGIDCGTTCRSDYEEGTLVYLSQRPMLAGRFLRWEGCESSTPSQCVVRMTANRTVIARFVDGQIPLP